ncbi:hypothetical protein Fsol_00374 [Candidatus Fokinia solitaria]|uniref:Uncharacterized protein n=1 Tax=Candidatus Fokinia solitaria TaxID=1802984 RepID=A0A2U8BS54_9RICK|nr:hypothetical protein Fsol_00374 [Candidatus Fokinia solitaria]
MCNHENSYSIEADLRTLSVSQLFFVLPLYKQNNQKRKRNGAKLGAAAASTIKSRIDM